MSEPKPNKKKTDFSHFKYKNILYELKIPTILIDNSFILKNKVGLIQKLHSALSEER